jgi:hypothetical protein
MALTITTDTLYDGLLNTVMQFTGFTDEQGDPEPVVAVDVSELSPPARAVKVSKVTWSVQGGTLKLAWATEVGSDPFLNLTGQGEMDYGQINGAVNHAEQANGDILISTDDFGDGSNFSVSIEMRKKY